MFLKRFYKTDGLTKEIENGQPLWRDKDGNRVELELDYISLGNTGTTPEQNFSIRFVDRAQREGWAMIEGYDLLLDVYPEPLTYRIVRRPGRYCCHCGETVGNSTEAQAHVLQKHGKEKSPDPSNPAGYMQLNAFACVLNAEQHEKYRSRGEVIVKFPRKNQTSEVIDG